MYYKPIDYIINSQEELETLGHEWQEKLGLQNWNICFELCRQCDFKLQNVNGENSWTRANMTSIINVLKSDEAYNPCFKYDMELIVVHELLHLYFAVLQPDSGSEEEMQVEQSIELIAKALVQSKRDNKEVISYAKKS